MATFSSTFEHSIGIDLIVVLLVASIIGLLIWLRLRQVSIRLRERHEARLTERDRIARDLHDTLLQAMEGLILKVYAAARQLPSGHPTYHLLSESLDQAEELAIEGRRKLFELRNPQESRLELSEALSAVGLELAADSTTSFTVSKIGDVRVVTPVAWDEIFSIVREAMGNAFKHAKASTIAVIVNYSRSKFIIQVRDDGLGTNAHRHVEANGVHFGFRGMGERARQLRASLAIKSAEGAGTMIILQVPAHVAYQRGHSDSEAT